ncbi:MAG TPA: hypothetical protein ENN88_04820 [Candidatus Coatesbacteria bacterium]|mgnify:CR=1 FL=1|nr:hypothetical protein [Candidatus Coatesbacteria bacterium]
MREPLARLTIHFIGGPLALELPPTLHSRLTEFYSPFLTDEPAQARVAFDQRPPVSYNIELCLRITYPEAEGRRVIREPRFELSPDDAGARVKFCTRAFQDADFILRAWAAMLLLPPEGFVFHAAGLVTPAGRGVLVCGRSGSGKSTLAGNLAESPGWSVLSDEMPAVRREPGGWSIGFTPFWGDAEHRMPGTRDARLRGICALEQGDGPALEPMSPADGAALLLGSVTSYEPPPWFADAVLPFAADISRSLPFHRLTVPRSFDAARLAELFDEGGA